MSARRAILEDLTTDTKTVTELAEPFDMTMPALSKHLKVLCGCLRRATAARE